MKKVVVVSHSYRGVTDKLIEALVQGVREAGGTAAVKPALEASVRDILDADAVVLAGGQPFGLLNGPLKTFLERCWVAPEKAQLQGKGYTYVLNGSSEPSDTAAYVQKVAGYFKMTCAAPGLVTTGAAAESALPKARELGRALVA